MQYQAHSDFLTSLHDFYQKDGHYRKAANKVLAAWAKSQNQEIFSAQHVFQGFNLTHHGENRINYCFKYDLHDFSRLVTQQHHETCTFLFVGTHQEVDDWLNKNRGLLAVRDTPTPKQIYLTAKPAPSLSRLSDLRNHIALLKEELAEYEGTFKHLDIRSNNYNESLKKGLEDQFHSKNTTDFTQYLAKIRQSTLKRNTAEAIEQAENLELFTEFIKLKVKYIATLKEYLEVSKNLH